MTTNPVINELLNMAAQRRSERYAFQQKMQKQLQEHDKKIEAVEATLRLYAEYKDLGDVRPAQVAPDDFKG